MEKRHFGRLGKALGLAQINRKSKSLLKNKIEHPCVKQPFEGVFLFGLSRRQPALPSGKISD